MKRKITTLLSALILTTSLFTAGCGAEISSTSETATQSEVSETSSIKEAVETQTDTDTSDNDSSGTSVISLSDIPEYSGDIYVEVNGNEPFFTADELTTEVFEEYSELDSLGRCGVAYANVCQELMPTEERGDISSVYPTGWEQNYYDFVDGGYVYNRSHLIAHELCAEDSTPENLITGCRTFNVEGMLPFENMVSDYVKETDHHVLYRVTPIFEGDNLLASGVLMEAQSVEDDEICFCVYVYNVEPGVTIDYATGENYASGSDEESTEESSEDSGESEEMTYVLNRLIFR